MAYKNLPRRREHRRDRRWSTQTPDDASLHDRSSRQPRRPSSRLLSFAIAFSLLLDGADANAAAALTPASAANRLGQGKASSWLQESPRRRTRAREVNCLFVEASHFTARGVNTKPTSTATTTTALRVKYKTFDEMILNHRDTPLLIDFYAPWCGPCKLMKAQLKSVRPRLEQLGPRRASADGDGDEGVRDDASAKRDGGGQTSSGSRPTGIPVFHVNANKFPQVGARNKIHGLPTLVLYFEGEEVWRNEGILMGNEIVDALTGVQDERGWAMAEEA